MPLCRREWWFHECFVPILSESFQSIATSSRFPSILWLFVLPYTPMGLHIAVYPIGINYSVILFHSSVGFARPLLTMTVLRGREPHDAYSPLPMSVASMKRSSPGLSIFARPNSINIRPMPHR